MIHNYRLSILTIQLDRILINTSLMLKLFKVYC